MTGNITGNTMTDSWVINETAKVPCNLEDAGLRSALAHTWGLRHLGSIRICARFIYPSTNSH